MGASCSSEESRGEIDYTDGGEGHSQRVDATGDVTSPVHNGPILDLAWSERSSRMVTCSDDKRLCLIDWELERETTSRSDRTHRRYFDGHAKAVNRVSMNQSSGHIWSVSRDLSLRCWDSESGACLQHIEDTHELNVSAVASSTGGDKVFTGSRDYHVKGWDVETGKSICDFHTPRNIVTAMKFGTDSTEKDNGIADASSMLFQASEDLSIKVWDVRTASKTPAIRVGGFVYFALSLDIANNGHLLAAGCKGFNGVGCDVKLWDLRNLNRALSEGSEHQQDVTSVRFLSNQMLSSCSKDGSVHLWDTHTDALQSVAVYNSGNKYTSLSRLDGSSGDFAAGSFEGHLELFSYGAGSGDITCKQAILGPREEGD